MATAEVLPNAKVTLFDDKLTLINTAFSDEKGNYSFPVECGKRYSVRAAKEEYTTKEQIVTIAQRKRKNTFTFCFRKRKM